VRGGREGPSFRPELGKPVPVHLLLKLLLVVLVNIIVADQRIPDNLRKSRLIKDAAHVLKSIESVYIEIPRTLEPPSSSWIVSNVRVGDQTVFRSRHE
jgi:hypothetical protein